MLPLLLSAALAAELRVVGFSPTGHLFTWAETEARGAAWWARLYTVDVASGTWNHYPVEATAPSAEEAMQVASRQVPTGYVVPAAEAVPGAPLALLREGSRDHTHGPVGAPPHISAWSMRLEGQTAVATLEERRHAGCADAVEPWLRWESAGASVELLADRNPPRWPACALSFELSAVLTGPRRGVVLLLRALELDHGEPVFRWTVASARRPG